MRCAFVLWKLCAGRQTLSSLYWEHSTTGEGNHGWAMRAVMQLCRKLNDLEIIWRRGWESNPSGGLIRRKLLILQNSKTGIIHTNAEARYTAGTRESWRRGFLSLATATVTSPKGTSGPFREISF